MKHILMTSPDAKSAQRIASVVLQKGGMRLHLLWAALLCLVLGGGGLYLIENVFAVVPWATLYYDTPVAFYALDALYTAVDIGYVVFLVCPMIYGAATVFFASADGQQLPLSSLFDAFSCAKRYLRAVLVVGAKVLPRALFLGLLVTLCRTALGASSLIAALLWWLLTLIVLAGAALALGLDDALVPLAMSDETLGVFKLYRTSLSLCAPRLVRILRFKLGFILWALASIATLGVLLFAHALPYYCLAHAAWADGIYREN